MKGSYGNAPIVVKLSGVDDETCTPQEFSTTKALEGSRRDRLEPMLVMETGENGSRHDPMT
jgi:hypothetical protein